MKLRMRGGMAWALWVVLLLSGCGGGGGGTSASTAAPSVSGTTDIATTLSVTVNENGTGYYLV